jgi:hypothetical protein
MKNYKKGFAPIVLIIVIILVVAAAGGYLYLKGSISGADETPVSTKGEVIMSGQAYGPILFSKNEDKVIYTIQKGSRDTYYECSPGSKEDYLCSLESTDRNGCYANPDGSMCIYIERGPVIIGEAPLYYSLYLKKGAEQKRLYKGEDYPRGYWSRDNHVYIVVPAHGAKQELIKVY